MTKSTKPCPSNFQKKTCWASLTAFSCLVLFAIAAFTIVEVIKCLNFLEPVLLPVLIAAVLAYLLEPVVSFLVRKLKFSRTWSVLSVIFLTLMAIVGFGMTIFPPLIAQTNELIDNRDDLWNKTTELIDTNLETPFIAKTIDIVYESGIRNIDRSLYSDDEIDELKNVHSAREKLKVYMTINSSFYQERLIGWLNSGGRALYSACGIVVGIVIAFVFTFYFLLEADKIKEKWPSVLPIKASRFREEVVETMEEINGYLISFFRGQMLVSIIEGVLIAILLKCIGLPYAITIGAAICILGIIPYIGIISAAIPALLIAWVTWGDWQHIIMVLSIFIGINQFDGWVIQPKIVGDSVGLHPLTVMFSVLIWTLILGGLIGALLAVPLTAGIKVLYKRYIWQSPTMRTRQEALSCDATDDETP